MMMELAAIFDLRRRSLYRKKEGQESSKQHHFRCCFCLIFICTLARCRSRSPSLIPDNLYSYHSILQSLDMIMISEGKRKGKSGLPLLL